MLGISISIPERKEEPTTKCYVSQTLILQTAADSATVRTLSQIKQLSIHHKKTHTAAALQCGVPALNPGSSCFTSLCVQTGVHGCAWPEINPCHPRYFPPCFLRESLTSLKSKDWAGKLTSEQQGSNCGSLSTLLLQVHGTTPSVCSMVWEPNSGCHTCVESTLPTEPSPSPPPHPTSP